MELCKRDRALLASQYRILQRLDPEEDFGAFAEILERGFVSDYSRIENQAEDSELPKDECRLVMDIFEVYRALDIYRNSNPGDRHMAQHPWARFRGFDGNRESAHLAFSCFLMREQRDEEARLPGAAQDVLDSHVPTLSKYRFMIAVWNASREGAELSKQTVAQILGPANTGDALPGSADKRGGVLSRLASMAGKAFIYLTGGSTPIPPAKTVAANATSTPEPARVQEREPAAPPPSEAPAVRHAIKPEMLAPKLAPKVQPGSKPKTSAPKTAAKAKSSTPAPKMAPSKAPKAQPKASGSKPATKPSGRSKPKSS